VAIAPPAATRNPALAREEAFRSVVTPGSFRRALARHAGGVVVVTVRGHSGPVGFTVTSFTSASLSPPLVSFYVGHDSASWPAVRSAAHFAVNLLGVDQEKLAARFALKGADRFAPPTDWHPGSEGLPLLADATTHLVCRWHASTPVGDHELVVGAVVDTACGTSDQPLIYHSGRFARAIYHLDEAAPPGAEGG
jgi:flavin reductase (DIM6/NTAB) family NADH-FMN oxidoreductase RutF